MANGREVALEVRVFDNGSGVNLESKFKDMVDASSSAFTELESGNTYSAPPTDGGLSKESYWRK